MMKRDIEYCQSKKIDTGRAYTLYYGYRQTGQQVWLCNGYLIEAGKEDDVQGRPGDTHSRKIYRRRESAEVVFAEWLPELTEEFRRLVPRLECEDPINCK